MSKNNKKILRSCIIMLSMFLSACTDNSNPKFFDDNIKEFNEFSNDIKEDDKEDKVLVFKNPFNQSCKKANLVAKGIKLNQLAALLSETYESEISYAINSDAQGNIVSDSANKDQDGKDLNVLSVNFKNVCLEEVLDTLTDVYNIGVVDTSSGYQLYQSPSQTITYELNYHNFQRKGSSAISITSSQLTNTSSSGSNSKDNKNYSTITSTSEDKFWESVTSAISSILRIASTNSNSSKNSTNSANQFYVYKEAGLIIVTASPQQHKNIRKFLKKANANSSRQVMIEAKILEVTLNDEFRTGIRWDALKNSIYQNSFSTIKTLIPNRDTSHLTSNLQNSDNELVSSGKIESKDFNLIMQALGEQGQVSVMSSPRVAALNNQRALIKSGEDQYFVTNVSNIQIDSGTSKSSTSQTTFNVEPLFSGISLDTTPNIISNEEILLHIHPMISRITKDKSEVTLNDKSTTVPVALVSVREVDTVVKSRSGDIIILGGMTNNSTKLSKSSLPLHPTKGFQKIFDLFSAKQNKTTKSELIILMKPTIIENFSSIEKLGKFRDMSSDKSIEE